LTRLAGQQVELVEITTSGDRSSAPISTLGVGVFVSALREALRAKEVDLAVHSYKDLPSAAPDDLAIAAVPERADPRDALVARDGLTLDGLPTGARVGTSAVRRVAQLLAIRPDLDVVPLRGNVDTRLRKLAGSAPREGTPRSGSELDAIVVAYAGLSRLNRADAVTEILDPDRMLPAPAQGALAVECRADQDDLVRLLGGTDHRLSRAAVTAERALLATLEAGCSAPVAGYATIVAGSTPMEQIDLRGAVFSPDGRTALRLRRSGTLASAEQLGRQLAADLLDAGANTLLGVKDDPHP
ncbi:MAG: hydroxymethylbilane synthase, partial [Micromonosporaceae bacterium]|nr:hydroxymethylbilane synthase [Micromonosporaceae bacterium]